MSRADDFVAVDCATLPWTQSQLPSGDPKGVHYRAAIQGREGFPSVHLNRYEPGWTEARHRHVDDEVLALIEGEIEVDGVTHCAPAVIYVRRGTLYGPLTAGPKGVAFYRVAYTENSMRPKRSVGGATS